MSAVYDFNAGPSPLLISMPHNGVAIPGELAARMCEPALASPDTDWHLDRLYDFAANFGASVLVSRVSRYVIDLNRPPDNHPLYPGADNTGLCPTTQFDYQPIYRDGAEPDQAEIAARIAAYWRPYHERLRAEIDAVRRRCGYAVLLDAHSIAAEVPRFFAGRLPDFNLGTADGLSCAAVVARAAERAVDGYSAFSRVTDGRFKGGYITRHYGDPGAGVHAIQLELSQATYLADGTLGEIDEARAAAVQPALTALVEALAAVDPRGDGANS